ncbi:MAG: hypothetical protein HKM04_07805 [Legionellales bacterium]|nr:hypothetical protein [Legionellales bacterium]
MRHRCKLILGFLSVIFVSSIFASNLPEGALQALEPEMFTTMKAQADIYQEQLLAAHPVIVALFSPAGGQFVLYRPGQAPLIAPVLPQAQDYEFATLVEHAAMSTYAVAIRGINDSTHFDWQNQLQEYQKKIGAADASINNLTVSSSEKILFHRILGKTNDFMTQSLKQNTLSPQNTANYADSLKPDFVRLSKLVIDAQVNHWMGVTADWKKLLGKDWGHTYGVVLYIDTRPQNNIFLAVLAYYMGESAVGKQLFYFTTQSYSPTAEQAIEQLAKTMPDKVLANQVYGGYYLSYSQILGQTARAAMKAYSGSNHP